jgi:hypothetical protein
MDHELNPVLPEGLREGDVLIYMGGQLLIVDHLIPEAFTIDLVALNQAEEADRATP